MSKLLHVAFTAAIGSVVTLGSLGCPGESPGPRAGDKSQPAAGAPGGHGGFGGAPASQPASAPASQPSQAGAPAPAGPPFTGSVRLADGSSADAVKPTDVLFIMVRPAGMQRTPPIAVQRHGNVQIPLRYEISSKDSMMPGMPFTGPFMVTARLDRDGDPMSKGLDDLYAEAAGEVQPGQQGVDLVLGPAPAGAAEGAGGAPGGGLPPGHPPTGGAASQPVH